MPDLSRVRGLADVVGALEPAQQWSALHFCLNQGVDMVGMIVWAGAVPAFLMAAGIHPGTVAAGFVHHALLAAAQIRPVHGRPLTLQHAGACGGAVPSWQRSYSPMPYHGPMPHHVPPAAPTSVMWGVRAAAPTVPFGHDVSVPLREAPHAAPSTCRERRADRESASATTTTGQQPSASNEASRRRCRRGRRGAGARGYSEC